MSSLKKLIDRYVKKGVVSNPITYQTGRIKRMRTRREIRDVRLLSLYVKSLDIFDNSNIFYPITRWNRH